MFLPASLRSAGWLLPACALIPFSVSAKPLVSEIMFHPPGIPENTAQEWIELHNPDAIAADLSGHRLTKGVQFTFPAGTLLPAGGFLVVAADPAAFLTSHPGFSGSLTGGWTGRLSNSSEQIQLEDAAGVKVNDVTYATEGDWGLRVRGALSFSHRGWDWLNEADGGGLSLELQNPALGNGSGQNWAVSLAPGGTPGLTNSIASANLAPLIKSPRQYPKIPRTGEPVTISCTLEDELPGPTATLRWRVDGAATFQTLPMADSDGDGTLDATIPAQADRTIVEWYLSATDGALTRTWPAPARTSNPGVTPVVTGQAVNALYQVDHGFDPAAEFRSPGQQPLYRLILTAADRNELTQLQTTSGQEDSEATFPCTFVSQDGTGAKLRHQAGVRNRGLGSALGPPNNYHIGFASDDLWNGRKSFALNCQYGYSQMLGQAAMAVAGLATQEAAIVRVRLNGTDPAQSGSRMFGRFVRLEGRDSDWAQHHYPEDPEGNFYRLDDHEPGSVNNPPGNLGSGEFRYEGENPAAYADTFIKETKKGLNDYSDLAAFTRIVSAPATGGTASQPAISDADYPAAVAAVLDLDNFYRYLAADALIGNQEGGLQSGRADDASIYRGILDPRFRFIPHDLDDVFDIGEGAGNPVTRSLFSYDTSSGGVEGLTRLFNHPQLLPRYYSAVLEALDTWFNHATLDPLIDENLAGWVPATDGSAAAPNRGIAEIKAYIDSRRANILSQIQQNDTFTVTTAGGTSPEGYSITSNGSATLGGTFSVARTGSITVNGQPALLYYRDSGGNSAGTWRLLLPAGGGGVLRPGLNKVVAAFHPGPGGTGPVLHRFTADVLWTAAAGSTVSGTLSSPGSLDLIAPDSYVPGVPILVRVDLKDTDGNLNRRAWNSTVTLTASNGVLLSPSTVTLTNGMGSALVSIGGTGGGTQTLLSYGTGGTGTAGSGTPGSVWRSLTSLTADTIGSVPATWKDETFDDSAWVPLAGQTGYGDNDENTPFPRVDYSTATGTQSSPSYLFRSTFNLTDPAQFAGVSGQVKFDDSCAVYVNGQEIYRHADLTANAPLTEYTETTTGTTRENATADFTVPAALLHTGTNTIAVEVHQHDAGSSDVTFDLRLSATLPSADPGNFTLGAATGGVSSAKALTSRAGAPETVVSGTLPAGSTVWTGLVRVTGDLTVPAGSTLTVNPGTHVLFTGTSAPGDTGGSDLIVSGGTLAINGTSARPVSFSAANPATRWGQIYLNAAQPTACNWLLLSHAAHAPGQGHTGRGPVFRLNGSSLTLNDCAIGDSPGKALYSAGTCDFVMARSLMTRMITGPELEDGASLVMTDSNIQDILPDFRESNSPAPDDEDALYVHNSAGRPVTVSRCVFSRCGDDLFDCLAGPITVEDTILREAWDKGMSLLDNDLTISRTLIVNCDKAIVPKSRTAVTRTVNADRCTIFSENHDTTLAPWGYPVPPNDPDPDSPSTGLYTQNKSGQSNTGATLAITATNCIIIGEAPVLVDSPYNAANTVVLHSITRDSDTPATPAWPGTGNSNADPQFVSAASGDYHLAPGSPAINTGDPAATDPDGSRADMGALPTGSPGGAGGGAGEIRWNLSGSPWHVTGNTTVPAGVTLRIDPGVNVWFNQNARLTVNGRILAEGTPGGRIVFSHVPGTVLAGDTDPVKNGVQPGAPKWGGIRIYDSLSEENVFRYCDFINAQGTGTGAPENFGSVGFIRSRGWVDHCTWAGTHLRMCYGRNSIMTVTHNVFPDMFIFDPVLNRIENPTDFVASADNNQEPLKVEYPTTDPEVSGNPAYPNGQPAGGHWRVYYNEFNGNRGHNDVFDADSGRWGQTGQFVLDCRYNHFRGISGDEHIDLGGDAYIASNIFERATKDQWTSDTGYSNAVSSGDKGSGTTIMLARNICYDLDHVINCKLSTATIFEHNTVTRITPDFQYNAGSFNQSVKCAPVNFFIPEDGTSPTYGDGAYLGYNLISSSPRLFSGADARKTGGNVVNDITTKIEFHHNLLSSITDPAIGPNHPGGIFGGTYGPNESGEPGFTDPASNDFSLRVDSAARGTAPGGLSYGAEIPEWTYVLGGPVGTVTATTASFTVGGPGVVAYRWRLNGGAWSASIQIGSGGVLPRGATPTMRQATLTLTSLSPGPQALEILGQDMAGNWQDADPARTLESQPQAGPSVRTWTVDPAFQPVRLSEITANGIDSIELENIGENAVDISGWILTDNTAPGGGFPVPAGTVLAGGARLTFEPVSPVGLDADGDTVRLFDSALTLQDSLAFGAQPVGFSLGRHPLTSTWVLCLPTPSAPNTPARLGDPAAVRISEWFVSGTVLYKHDWVELSNPSTLPVSLASLTLTDSTVVGASAHSFFPLSFLAPGGFGVYHADGRPQDGPSHLNFSLDAQQDELLLASDGRITDRVLFGPGTTDWSATRVGSGLLAWHELPTRGFDLSPSDPAYQNALALLQDLRITEIMYNPPGGSNFEYLELTNTGILALNLGGLRFTTGIGFTFPAMTLAPGTGIVLVANPAAFRNRYGAAPVIAGTYTGRLDNAGETLTLQLAPPFDANALCFTYQNNWYTSTDGSGYSLELRTPVPAADSYSERASWNASADLYGSPGGVTVPASGTFAQWLAFHQLPADPAFDADGDGIGSLTEYALDTDPLSGNPENGQDQLPRAVFPLAGGSLRPGLNLSLAVSALPAGCGRGDVNYLLQDSDDLVTWRAIAELTPADSAWRTLTVPAAAVAPDAPLNGRLPFTISSPDGTPGSPRKYIRLHLVVP